MDQNLKPSDVWLGATAEVVGGMPICSQNSWVCTVCVETAGA